MQVIISIWLLTTKKSKHKSKNPNVSHLRKKRHLFCITGFGESVFGSLDHGKELKIRGSFICHLLILSRSLENVFMQLLPNTSLR